MPDDFKDFLDPQERGLLERYACWMEGRRYPQDPFYDPIRPEQRTAAGEKYMELRQTAEARALQAANAAIASDKHDYEKSARDRELELEYAKLEVEKARVVADMMTAAAVAGKGDALAVTFEKLAGHLLGDGALRAIADKGSGGSDGSSGSGGGS